MLLLWAYALASIAQDTCLTQTFLTENDVPYRTTREGQEAALRIGLPIWGSGQTSANMLDILISEVLGFDSELVGSATYASGPLFFDTLPVEVDGVSQPGNLDLVIEIWEILNPSEIANALFVDYSIQSYSTLGYVSGDGLFVPDYAMDTTYWNSQGIPHPQLFHSMYESAYQSYFSQGRTASQWKDWIKAHHNMTARFDGTDCGGACEPTFEFHHETCANNPCILWIMLDPAYMYNRYQSLVRNWDLPVVIMTWSYMDTVLSIVPALFNAEEPFMTMSFFPDTFQLQYNLQNRILFPQSTQSCMDGQNSTSTQGYGTYDCGFEKTNNWKFGSTAFHDNPFYADLHTNGFLTQATVPDNPTMDAILTSVNNGNATGFRDAACQWLQSSVEIWKPWIYITPELEEGDEFPLEKILGITVGCLIAMMGVSYFVYMKFFKHSHVELRLFQQILNTLCQIILEAADYVSDLFIFIAAWMPEYPTMNSGLQLAIVFAGIIVTVSSFVLVWALYGHFKEMYELWHGSDELDEDTELQRKNTLNMLRQNMGSMKHASSKVLNVGDLPDHSPSMICNALAEEEELQKMARLGEELDAQYMTIQAVLHDVSIHGIIMLTEDIPFLAINILFMTSIPEFRNYFSTWFAFFMSCLSIGYKLAGFGYKPYLSEFLRIIKLMDMGVHEGDNKKSKDLKAKLNTNDAQFDEQARLSDVSVH